MCYLLVCLDAVSSDVTFSVAILLEATVCGSVSSLASELQKIKAWKNFEVKIVLKASYVYIEVKVCKILLFLKQSK